MQKKNIFKALAAAMLMPAMLLTTACSNQDDVANINNEPTVKKGYALPVTVNVTRQGDATTRATFDGSKLNFSEYDKLFVEGKYATGSKSFAGALDYVSEGTFSGTIYAQDNTYSTYNALLMAASSVKATLLPNGYGSTGFISIDDNSTPVEYDDVISATPATAFVASGTAKATGVEQLSLEQASTYSNGFALDPQCAILNFTISGLEAGEKTVTLNVVNGTDYTVTGSVTPTSGVATFAIGVPVGANIKDMDNNLTVGSSNFTLPSTTTFAAGKIYNINRAAPAATDLSTITENYEAKNGETLTGTLTSNVKISIADGATVTLKDVTITNLGDDCDWAGINCPGDAILVLEGTNEVCAGIGEYGLIFYPGIWIAQGKTLTIQGAGNLTANSNITNLYGGAGIGGGYGIACGNIVINSGTITATGGLDAAGIGAGGSTGSCGNITINGGTITATSDGNGAGIGGGFGNACGNITISGGTVSATGGDYAAGIGGGRRNGDCGTITIKSTVTSVTATKGSNAPNSIGSGADNGTAITVTIEDPSKVTQN